MKYLLDVNALVALGFIHHEFHDRVAAWVRASQFPPLATCSITELGFVRVLSQAPAYGFTVAHARTLLLRLKKASKLSLTFSLTAMISLMFPRGLRLQSKPLTVTWFSLPARMGLFLRPWTRKYPELTSSLSARAIRDEFLTGG
jgi:hypothetical protein